MRTAAISAVVIALIFSGLTLQMARGGDPVIGSGGTAKAETTKTTAQVDPTAGYSDDEDDGAVVTQPVTPTPQPVTPAPAPVAPTPAPVQTSTS